MRFTVEFEDKTMKSGCQLVFRAAFLREHDLPAQSFKKYLECFVSEIPFHPSSVPALDGFNATLFDRPAREVAPSNRMLLK